MTPQNNLQRYTKYFVTKYFFEKIFCPAREKVYFCKMKQPPDSRFQVAEGSTKKTENET